MLMVYVSLIRVNSDELVTLEADAAAEAERHGSRSHRQHPERHPLAFVTTGDAHLYNTVGPYVSLPR
jgi:hypothetical protein